MANRNFNIFPILATERLTLRQLSVDDKQEILALRSNPEINKYLGRQPSKTIEDALNFINRINENIKSNNSIYWAISLANTKKLVGTICLFDFSDEKNSCEIGYELMPDFQGMGLMKEAASAVIGFAFSTLQFEKIVAFTHNGNNNSTKLLTKLGFTKATETEAGNLDFSTFILNYETI